MDHQVQDFNSTATDNLSAPKWGFSSESLLRPPMKTRSNDSAGSGGVSPAQLLISVRSEQEIDAAIAGGADIVDLKEPRNGPLAATEVEVWESVSRRATDPKSIQFSAALGESQDALPIAGAVPKNFAFAKVGPSGCDTVDGLKRLWSEVRGRLDSTIELVAVAYADHAASSVLPAETVFSLAADSGFDRCLIDTYAKDGRSTIDHLGIDGIRRLAQIAKERRLWWALAGSIRLDQAIKLREQSLAPDCFGVRGDVCDGGRTAELSILRVRRWKEHCLNQPNRVSLGS